MRPRLLLILLLPPRSTLFHYTTLFRSKAAETLEEKRQENKIALEEKRNKLAIIKEKEAEDRKSTRLNSSHTVISYAVFCLRKKTKNNKVTREAGIRSSHEEEKSKKTQ